MLIAEGNGVVKNVHVISGFRPRVYGPPLFYVVYDVVTNGHAISATVVDAVIMILPVVIIRLAPLLAWDQTANVVDEVTFHQNIVRLDVYAALRVRGICTDPANVIDVIAYNLEVASAVEQIDPAGASIRIGQTGHLKVLDPDVRRAASNLKTGAGFSVSSVDPRPAPVLRPEDNPFVRRAASRDTDDHFPVAIVRPAVGIDAVIYQDCIAGFDAISGFLNRPERARFGAGVGVRTGRRDMVCAPAALRRHSDAVGGLRLGASLIG
jgi:hypothetical protein